ERLEQYARARPIKFCDVNAEHFDLVLLY
ncbi:MAG: hypothetical protein JWM78_365, partial [Verrucomicrobiaceae bacterium]|nr:hypothetical protein [Verrucomicrobiaceae bacterium]